MLWVERMLAFEVLPKLVGAVEDGGLREAIERHLGETRTHVERVERAFAPLSAQPSSNRSAAFAALASEADATAAKIVEAGLRDVYFAWSAARTEHFELVLYDSLGRLLATLSADDAAELLRENREDEERALAAAEGASNRLAAGLAA